MASIKPYTLKQAQALVKDAVKRSKRRHDIWRALELLYRRGEAHESLMFDDVPAVLWQEFPGLTLDSINLILPNAQIIIANAVAHDPAFLVEPYSGGDEAEQQAKIGEQLLRYFWHRAEGTDIHRAMAQDMVLLGNGFCKVGWAFDEEEVDREEEELIEELVRLQDMEFMDADLMEREPRDLESLAEALNLTEPVVVQDEPFIKYVSPYDLFIERRARRISEARWVAERMILPLDELEANPNFDREAIKELTEVDSLEERPRERAGEEDSPSEAISSEFDGGEDPFREAVVYEFYDQRTRRVMVFAENGTKPLFEDAYPYAHRHSPYVHMRNLEDGDRFWSFGDIENVAAVQSEFNQYVYEQMASARRSGNKTVVDKAVWSDDLKRLLESEQGDIVAPINLGNRTMQDVIFNIERPPLPAEQFQAKHDLVDVMRDVMGINEFQAGGMGPDRMPATAAAIVDGNATLRAADKKFQVEQAAAATGLRMLLLCQEFLDEDLALRIVDANGVPEWLNVSNEDLTGEFRVSVTSGSTMAVNPATRMARALDVMTQIIPALQADGYDTHPLWRQAIRDYGMDPDRLLNKLPAPEELPGEPGLEGELPGADPTIPQEELGGPPVPAAVEGDVVI